MFMELIRQIGKAASLALLAILAVLTLGVLGVIAEGGSENWGFWFIAVVVGLTWLVIATAKAQNVQ